MSRDQDLSVRRGRSIVISVGTDHHPFDRIVRWADDWQARHVQDRVVVQHGWTRGPTRAEGFDFGPHREILTAMAAADVVITHGGPGTISDARRSDHRPIVVPRDPALGEHVDDHQLRFSAWCAERGVVELARSISDLERRLAEGTDSRQADLASASMEASVAAFAEIVGRPTVGRGSALAGSPRVVWLSEAVPAAHEETLAGAGAALVGQALDLLPAVVSGSAWCACGARTTDCVVWSSAIASAAAELHLAPTDLVSTAHAAPRVVRRRHLRRLDRVAVLAAAAAPRAILSQLSRLLGDPLVVMRGSLDPLLMLSHDRRIELGAVPNTRAERATLDRRHIASEDLASLRRSAPAVQSPSVTHGPDLRPSLRR